MGSPLPSPNWSPAAARAITLPVRTSLRAASLLAASSTLTWAPKSSADALDFTIDPTAWLEGTQDAISFVPKPVVTSATGQSTDLSPLWWGPVSGMVVVFMAGGPPGTTQTVNVTMISQQGRVLTQQVMIAVSLATAGTVPPYALMTAQGIGVPPNSMTIDGKAVLSIDGVSPLVIA